MESKNYKEHEKTKCFRIFSIPFENGTNIIELIGTSNLGSDPIRSLEVPTDCIIKSSPRQQITGGVSPEDVVCKNGMKLIFKNDNSPACVKPATAEKLIERGWGKIFENSTENTIRVKDTDFMVKYKITGGKLVSITQNVEAHSLLMAMTASQDGSLVITLPRALIDAKMGDQDDTFFVLVDGEEVDFGETVTSTDRTLTIQFSSGTDKIEIITTYLA
ncbi:MAG: hypothetical protein ACREAK_02390 [Nitrosarchaeum sp.]